MTCVTYCGVNNIIVNFLGPSLFKRPVESCDCLTRDRIRMIQKQAENFFGVGVISEQRKQHSPAPHESPLAAIQALALARILP